MFEQSILLDHAAGKKTGALAMSITLQTLGVSLLILIPLFYGDRLLVVQPFISLTVPLSRPPAPPAAEPAPVSQSAHSSLIASRVYRPQIAAAAIALTPVILDSGAPQIGPIGAPIGPPAIAEMPRIIALAPPPRELAPPVAAKAPDKPQPVGGDVQAAKLIKKVVPQYPPLARVARVSGTVHLIGIISKDGTIERLQVVDGNPLLIEAAVSAVRQWIYRPTLLNGVAVEVIAPIDVIFTLSQ